MNIEEIEDILEGALFGDEINKVWDYIKKLEADKLELSKAIVKVEEIQARTYGSGMKCHLDMITYADENKELFIKANKYIKEVEK